MPQKKAFVVPHGEGRNLNVLGQAAKVKIRGAETGGDYYVLEAVSPPGEGIPPHVHTHEDEILYVVEGEFEICLETELFRVRDGATVHLPRGVVHGFKNVGTTPGTTLFTVIPARNFEEFFEKLAALPPGPPDMQAVEEIFSKHEIRLLPAREDK